MRYVLLVGMAMAAALTDGPGPALAQDATPIVGDSALRSMGFAELLVRVTDETIEAPAEVGAGRTLITLVNTGTESWHGFLLRLPDGMTYDEAEAQAVAAGDQPPAFLFESTFPGFPGEALPGEQTHAVVELPRGRYFIVEDAFQPIDVVAGGEASPVPALALAPSADAVVRLFEYGFELPDRIDAGPQVWEVSNAGREPHELLIASVPRQVTVDEVLAMLQAEDSSPPAGGLSFQDFVPVGGLGWLSQGQTAWTELDLEPGNYVLLCFVPDPETGMPHVAMGMVAVFTVA